MSSAICPLPSQIYPVSLYSYPLYIAQNRKQIRILMGTIFTKIINGEIPCHKVAETDTHIAFLDINPIAEGHTLIVPKKEIDYFFDLPDDLISSTMTFAKQVARSIDTALDPIRTGVIVEGLEVPHAHVHLVPIYKKTQVVALGHSINMDEERMPEIAEKIGQAYQDRS